MRNGYTKILLLLGLVIFIGVLFLILSSADSVEKAQQIAPAVKKEIDVELTQEQKEQYSAKLKEFKESAVTLDMKDTKKFRAQTGKAFTQLAELIDGLPTVPGSVPAEVLEETVKIKQAAEKINIEGNEKKLSGLIKEGFEHSGDAIQNLIGNISDENEKKTQENESAEKFSGNVKKKLEVIEERTDKIDVKNYKQMTKEIFMHFTVLLAYMEEQMSNPEIMSQNNNQGEDEITAQGLNEQEQQNAEQNQQQQEEDKAMQEVNKCEKGKCTGCGENCDCQRCKERRNEKARKDAQERQRAQQAE